MKFDYEMIPTNVFRAYYTLEKYIMLKWHV